MNIKNENQQSINEQRAKTTCETGPAPNDTNSTTPPEENYTGNITNVTLWQKIKPWYYMALMFVLLFCIGKLIITSTVPQRTRQHSVTNDSLSFTSDSTDTSTFYKKQVQPQ